MAQPPPVLASCPAGHIPGHWLQQIPWPSLRLTHCRGVNAARWGPFLLWGCSESATHFLQAGPKQRPPLVPSGSEGGLGHSAGKFGEDGQDGPSLLLLQVGTSAALGLLLPFLQDKSIPITLQQERAEPLGVPRAQMTLLS